MFRERGGNRAVPQTCRNTWCSVWRPVDTVQITRQLSHPDLLSLMRVVCVYQ